VPERLQDAIEPKKIIMKQHINQALEELLEEDKTAVLVPHVLIYADT
jgi:hypothetical protein